MAGVSEKELLIAVGASPRNIILVKFEQFWSANSPIDVTLFGNVIVLKLEQS